MYMIKLHLKNDNLEVKIQETKDEEDSVIVFKVTVGYSG